MKYILLYGKFSLLFHYILLLHIIVLLTKEQKNLFFLISIQNTKTKLDSISSKIPFQNPISINYFHFNR